MALWDQARRVGLQRTVQDDRHGAGQRPAGPYLNAAGARVCSAASRGMDSPCTGYGMDDSPTGDARDPMHSSVFMLEQQAGASGEDAGPAMDAIMHRRPSSLGGREEGAKGLRGVREGALQGLATPQATGYSSPQPLLLHHHLAGTAATYGKHLETVSGRRRVGAAQSRPAHHAEGQNLMQLRAGALGGAGGGERKRRPETAAAPSSELSSSKRSRAEKHYKEIELLCNALGPHLPNVNVLERALRMYDRYRNSGKAAGRPSRPMYAAVVLAMSGPQDEEGDETDCKLRLPLVVAAAADLWGADAPDSRKIWDSTLVLLRIVPLRCPQDNLAGSVLTRLFRSILFSRNPQEQEATTTALVCLARTLEQGRLCVDLMKKMAWRAHAYARARARAHTHTHRSLGGQSTQDCGSVHHASLLPTHMRGALSRARDRQFASGRTLVS